MSAASPTNGEPPVPPPSRYGGILAALYSGLVVVGLCFLVGLLLIWLLRGGLSRALIDRLALLALTAGAAAALSQWIRMAVTARRPSVRFSSGGWAGVLGLMMGLLLAGYVGERSLELAGPTLDGGRFNLSQHHGKVVLVDFWATWCPPCVAGLPKVRAIYDKYHDSGLEVVGVSLDYERAALVKFLDPRSLPWQQIFFDEEGARGWNSPLAVSYNVRSIPCVLVFDREGKLVGRDLHGEQLETALAEALGVPLSWEERWSASRERLTGWLIRSVSSSPWWLVLLCGLGGTAFLALLEAGLRSLRIPRVRETINPQLSHAGPPPACSQSLQNESDSPRDSG